MPRFVRNFWVETISDGKAKATGPRTADGGFSVNIKVRDKGSVSPNSVDIFGKCEKFGDFERLTVWTFDVNGNKVILSETVR